MEERDFSTYLILLVAVVAVVGLVSSGTITGFAAKKVKSPACAAAEKALGGAQNACSAAKKVYGAAQLKCDNAKKAYAAAQASFAKTPTQNNKNTLDQKKKAQDSACAAAEKSKQSQDRACAAVSQATTNKNAACAPPAASPEPASAPVAGPECTDTDLNPDHLGRADINSLTLNYTVAGTVHGAGGQGMAPMDYADRCDNPKMLKEFYCSRGPGSTWATDDTHDCTSEGKICQNGACVASCGNGQVDAGETCSSCPADAGCAAGQVCQNNACVVLCGNAVGVAICAAGQVCQNGACTLCGNGAIDADETCSSCAQDVRCADNQRCGANGQCEVRPFCRENYYQSVETEQGTFPWFECRDNSQVERGCQYEVVIERRVVDCGWYGCNAATGTCCWNNNEPVSLTCEGDILINTSRSRCSGQENTERLNCADPRYNGGGYHCVDGRGCAR